MKILLVDDSHAVAGLYQQMLEDHQYEVVTAYSGAEAMELALREQPDIGLLDFHLPDTTGDELTRRLLGHPATSNMVISMLSSYSDVTRKSFDAGAIDMITKETPEELFLLRVEALERKVLLQRESIRSAQRSRGEAEESPDEEPPFKVMLVDDSRFARSAYQAMLEESGCRVLPAESMQEALALARKERPDLAVVDFYMKGGNGDELTRALLSDPLTQNVLVVILTSQMEVKEVALAAGAIDVIYKGEQQGAFVQRVASIREYRRQIGRQIRRHIRSAEEAKRLHGWVESILQSMGEAVMVLDNRGVVIHANSAAGRLLGVGLETLLGEKMGDLLLQEGAGERQRTLLQRLLSGEEGLQSEGGAPSLSADYSVRCSDGRTVPVHLSGALLSRSSAVSTEVEGAVLVLHDLRERLRDEQQQQYIAFQSGIAEMSASILHHIGNTLVGIGGRVGGIGQRVQDMNRLREILNELGSSADVSEEAMREAMKVSAKALHNLSGEEGIAGDLQHIEESIRRIDRTISVHRSASRSDLSSSCFPLAGLVEDALFLLREPMQAAEIRVVTELNRELNQQVEMPRNPAIQMVLNLLQNSMDAILRRQAKAEAEWQGEIRVSIQAAPEGKVMLSIEDNGCGIEEEQRQHLFTPGYSTKPGGSGKNYFIKNRNKRQDTGSNPKSLCCNLLLTAGETLPAQSMIEVGIFMFVT